MEVESSFGRRRFNVCIHHSNRFGVVYINDRNEYDWNCSLGNENHQLQPGFNQRDTKSFGLSYRLNSSPIVFE